MSDEYVCALSGVEADEDALAESTDEAGSLPVGWTKVTFQRRVVNPRWFDIQNAKEALVEVTLSQIPEEAREQMRPLVTIQIDAQFASLEGSVDTFLLEEETVYVSPPQDDAAVATEFFELRERFGLANDAFTKSSDADEDDDTPEED